MQHIRGKRDTTLKNYTGDSTVNSVTMLSANSTNTSMLWTNTPLDNVTMLSINSSTGNVTNSGDNNVSAAAASVETEQCRLFRFMLYTIICGILCLLGFVGNTMSFLVLQRDRSAPVASFLLQVMAVADNLFLLLWFIHYSIKDVFRYFDIDVKNHPAWIYVRVYTFPFLFMTQMETIWLTVVVAMNRYMAVCLPYRAPSLCTIHNVYKEVVVVTIFSILYNIPRFLELTVASSENTIGWDRTEIGRDPVFQTLYIDAMYYLFTFVLPLLVLAFVNTRVIIAYHGAQKRKRSMTTRRAENENNITLVMIMVVAIFMICQAPARIVQLVWSYRYKHCEEFQYYLIHITNMLEVLNSSINFLIYFTFRKRFRDILGEYYCKYSVLHIKREKSLTTEALALSEYQPTTPAGSLRDSKHKVVQPNDNNKTIHENGNASQGTIDKTTQVKSVSNDEITELGEMSRETHHVSHAECHDEKVTRAAPECPEEKVPLQTFSNNVDCQDEQPKPTKASSRKSHKGEYREEQQPLNSDIIEYELSSENPVSRASSTDEGVLHDGQMLIATV